MTPAAIDELLRKLHEAAIEAGPMDWGLPGFHNEPGIVTGFYADPLRSIVAQWTAGQEPDWKHPKLQALLASEARLKIELQLVRDLLASPNDSDVGYGLSDYWTDLHDAVKRAAGQSIATHHCNICGGEVDLSNATKPTEKVGRGPKFKQTDAPDDGDMKGKSP